MYQKAYGIIETLAPLHVGASAGEESGNLNLIFRDQFTQTGIIPGSSIRGRFRADMRLKRQHWLEKELRSLGVEVPEPTQQEIVEPVNGKEKKLTRLQWVEKQAKEKSLKVPQNIDENYWYGNSADRGDTTEALVKFEYASLLWLPVFCPGQPIVWVTSPSLLKRYKRIAQIDKNIPLPYTNHPGLKARTLAGTQQKTLFFNLGFLALEQEEDLSIWCPQGIEIEATQLVIVDDNDIAMIHDMGLYRQTRVALEDNQKKAKDKGLFNVEALPVGSVLVFPIALKELGWQPFGDSTSQEMYFGGLESIGFGKCKVQVKTDPVTNISITSSLSGGNN